MFNPCMVRSLVFPFQNPIGKTKNRPYSVFKPKRVNKSYRFAKEELEHTGDNLFIADCYVYVGKWQRIHYLRYACLANNFLISCNRFPPSGHGINTKVDSFP